MCLKGPTGASGEPGPPGPPGRRVRLNYELYKCVNQYIYVFVAIFVLLIDHFIVNRVMLELQEKRGSKA